MILDDSPAFPGDLPRRDADRRGPRAGQPDGPGRQLRLLPGRQLRARCWSWRRRCWTRSSRELDARPRPARARGRRRPGRHTSFASVDPRPRRRSRAAGRHPPRGHGVLALQLGLDRTAEGRRPRPRRHRRDRRPVRPQRPADRRARRLLLDDQAVPRLRPRQQPVVPAARSAPARCWSRAARRPSASSRRWRAYRPTLFFSVPALYAAMVKAPGGADGRLLVGPRVRVGRRGAARPRCSRAGRR